MLLPLIQPENHQNKLDKIRTISICSLINMVKYVTYFVIILIAFSNDDIINFVQNDYVYFPLTTTVAVMSYIFLSILIDRIKKNCYESTLPILEYITLLIILINFTTYLNTDVLILFTVNVIITSLTQIATTFCNLNKFYNYVMINLILIIVLGIELIIVYSHHTNDYVKISVLAFIVGIITNISIYNLNQIINRKHHCIEFLQDDYLIINSLFLLDIINFPVRKMIGMAVLNRTSGMAGLSTSSDRLNQRLNQV